MFIRPIIFNGQLAPLNCSKKAIKNAFSYCLKVTNRKILSFFERRKGGSKVKCKTRKTDLIKNCATYGRTACSYGDKIFGNSRLRCSN